MYDFSDDDSEEDDMRANALDAQREKRAGIKLNLNIIDTEFAITFSASKEYKDYDKSAKVKMNLDNLFDKKQSWLDPVAKAGRKNKTKKLTK